MKTQTEETTKTDLFKGAKMKAIFEFIGFTIVVSCFVIGLITLCTGLIAKYGDELWVTRKFNNRVLKMDNETFEKYVELLRDFRKKDKNE